MPISNPAALLTHQIAGNTAGATANIYAGTYLLAGGNNVTLSQNSNSVTISAGAGGAAGSNTLGMSNLGNTSGTTGVVSGSAIRYFLAGGNNITLSQSLDAGNVSGTITISAANETQTVPPIATAVKVVQTSGSTGTITRFAPEDHAHQGVGGWDVNGVASTFFGTQQLSAGAMISIATGGGTSRGSAQIIDLWSSATTVSSVATANAVGAMASRAALEGHQHGGVPTVSVVGNTSGNTTQGNLSLILAGGPNITLSGGTAAGAMTVSVSAAAPFVTLSAYMPFDRDNTLATQIGQSSLPIFAMPLWNAISVSRANVFVSMSLSTSSNSSWAGRISIDVGIFSRNASTLSLASSGSVAHQWTNTSNNSTSVLSGIRMLSVPININASPGEYWVGVISRTGTVNANWFTASQLLATFFNNTYSGPLGSAANASHQLFPWSGIFTAQTAAMPASILMGGLSGTAAGNLQVPVINFVNFTV